MRENRTYGSEGGEGLHPFPTPIDGSGAHIEIFGQAPKISPAGDQTTTIFPGLRMLSGSSAFFIAHITSTASPCSAVINCILP